MRIGYWVKRIVFDGWLTTGEQLATPAGTIRTFVICRECHRVLPEWVLLMSADDAVKRGFVGCPCGCIWIQPRIIPAYRSVWWFVVRGWFVRKLILHKAQWDPRIVVLHQDLT